MKSIKDLLNFSIINIDKPSGPTSFQVSQFVMKTLNLKKTSHMGTLDPKVTGVLPMTLNRACKLSNYFMHKDKTYIGIMKLHSNISEEKLKEEMENFQGKITQLPPVRSSVKRAPREREVKSFQILEIKDQNVLFLAEVEAGTYIRKLIHDLGEKIQGAHMLELRRVKAGIFSEENSINLYDFEKAVNEYKKGKEEPLRKILIPAEQALKKIMPSIQAKGNIKQLLAGKPLRKEDIEEIPKQDTFALFQKDKFTGVYKKSEEKDIIARPGFVFN